MRLSAMIAKNRSGGSKMSGTEKTEIKADQSSSWNNEGRMPRKPASPLCDPDRTQFRNRIAMQSRARQVLAEPSGHDAVQYFGRAAAAEQSVL
jgi:hypothetical protein